MLLGIWSNFCPKDENCQHTFSVKLRFSFFDKLWPNNTLELLPVSLLSQRTWPSYHLIWRFSFSYITQLKIFTYIQIPMDINQLKRFEWTVPRVWEGFAIYQYLPLPWRGHLNLPLDTVQDFLIKLGINPRLHILETNISSLNHIIVRPTKTPKLADKKCA